MESTADIRVGDVVASRPAVSLEITSTPVLSYALAHNRIPVVSRLALTSDGPVRGATVRLSVRDAEGPIAQAVELLVDLDEGRTTVLTDVGLVMDPAAMLHVEEQRPGVLEVEVETDGELRRQHAAAGAGARRATSGWPLPCRWRWRCSPPTSSPTTPRSPGWSARPPTCSRSAPAAGRSRATPPVPSGSTRPSPRSPRPCSRRGVRHSEPPASWSDLGQQVRSPGDVLTWRVGTPLDTVVLLAAALEQAGIRPLLWLAEGHAFLGYWREERSANQPPPPTPRRWSTWSTSG